MVPTLDDVHSLYYRHFYYEGVRQSLLPFFFVVVMYEEVQAVRGDEGGSAANVLRDRLPDGGLEGQSQGRPQKVEEQKVGRRRRRRLAPRSNRTLA